MFQPDVLRWKCCTPHPFWDGSRGYALRHKGEIAAFGCVVPCRFTTGSGDVAGCNVIDWAASKAVPGAGIGLYRHIQSLTGAMINIGGSADARRVLPAIGFAVGTELRHYTRVLRPLHHMRQAGRLDWKTPLRLARDYLELARSAPAARSALRVGCQQVVCARTPESIAYVLACPAARMEARDLDGGGFLLSRVGGECRIADLWIRSPDSHDWAAAYSAATRAALADPETTHVTAAASQQLRTEALRLAGFRHTHSEPVFVFDPHHRLGDYSALVLSLLENDAFYWSGSAAHAG